VKRTKHLPDERLLSLYLGEGETGANDDQAHLDSCAVCARRYQKVESEVGQIGINLEMSADRVFTAERLARQRHHIANRLARLGTQARILEFPQSTHRAENGRAPIPLTTRWVAAAAAAGLIVGLGTGVLVDHRVHVSPTSVTRTNHFSAAGVARLSAPSVSAPAHLNEDQFLSDVEAALDESRAPELQALEAFTPRIQEISTRIK
jgi:hypothetical protein